MDDLLTINDLPVECVDEILKWITDRVDRIYARFVCKLWCALIDQDCSSECYQIDNPFYEDRTECNRQYHKKVDFNKMLSTSLLNSQRKKTSFHFDHVDFQGSEQFWSMKGAHIISLQFGSGCRNIPLREIVEHCSLLKSLTIDFLHNSEHTLLKVWLENCIAHGKINSSIRSLDFQNLHADHVLHCAKLLGRVFLGVQNMNVLLDESIPKRFDLGAANEVNSFTTDFHDPKFVITLSNDVGTLVFDPSSSEVPVKMTSLSFEADTWNTSFTSTHLSRYLCGLNHLIDLKIRLVYENYMLDDIQEIITRFPALKSLAITLVFAEYVLLTNPLMGSNNIEHLGLELSIINYNRNQNVINDVFFRSFENLKTFKCQQLVFSDFVTLLRQLRHLEKLNFYDGAIDVDYPAEETFSNESLLELKIPNIFLLKTIVKYDFSQLKKLYFRDTANTDEITLLYCDMDEHLKRVNCPKLEILFLSSSRWNWNINQDKFTEWMANILALYPRLAEFTFGQNNIQHFDPFKLIETTNNITLKTILKTHRRLRKVDFSKYSHIFNLLSPLHIKHRCLYGGSVLYVP